MEKKRILWLDSVKGISCWIVFLGHFVFCYGFLPFVYRWVDGVKYSSFVYNGNTAMDVFVIVSAFIEAELFLNIDDTFKARAGKGIIKRYFRFAIPVFMIEVIVFFLQKFGLWTDRFPAIPVRSIPFSEILYDSFYLSLFRGSSNVYPVFWMINVLFIGYMLALIVCAIVSAVNRVAGYIFLSVLLLVSLTQLNMFFLIFFGVFLNLIYRDTYENGAEKNTGSMRVVRYIVGVLFILISTYLSGQDEQLAYITTTKEFPAYFRVTYFYCWIAAALVMTGIVMCTPLLKLLNNEKLAVLGKICFPMFLIHPLCLVIFGEYTYRFFDARAAKYNHGTKAAFFVSLATTLILSLLYVKFVEPLVNKLTDRIMKIFKK